MYLSQCRLTVYTAITFKAIECNYRSPLEDFQTLVGYEASGWVAEFTYPLTNFYPPDTDYTVTVGEQWYGENYYISSEQESGNPGGNGIYYNDVIRNQELIYNIYPDDDYVPLFGTRYSEWVFPEDWRYASLYNKKQECSSEVFGPEQRLYPRITGYRMVCPFPIVDPPTLDDLNNLPPVPPTGPIGPINPGDPPLPPCKCMSCCDSSDASLSLLRKMAKTMGVDRYPVSLPRRMVQQGASGEVKLTDEIDRFEFLVRYIDRLLGLPPYQVEIKDSDPNKDGNQSVPARFESIAEMLKMLLDIELNRKTQASAATATGASVRDNNRTLFAMLNATLMEIGVVHKIVAEVRAEMLEQTEFLGYDTSEIERKVDFAFSPLAKSLRLATTGSEEETVRTLEEMLKPSLVPIRYDSNTDKKTLYQIVSDIRQQLLFMRGSIASPVKTKGDLRGILDSIEFGMNAAQLVLLRDIKAALGAMSQNDFKKYLGEIENRYKAGFSKNPDDKDKPYQEDIATAPEIKMQVEKPKLKTNGQ